MVDISVVIPCYNEVESILPLYQKLIPVLEKTGRSFEVVYIDDGSTDGTFDTLSNLHEKDPRIKVIQFRTNFGKSAALQAAFSKAEGKIVITVDADLQDDPQEIPAFLLMIDQGFDMVSGWKKVRNDPAEKRLPSRLFNFITSKFSGLKLHDFNCGFKAYKKEVLSEIDIYGEMHRFIPVLAHNKGFKVGELVVQHHAREFGKSKYGIERYLKGATDLVTILFLTKYLKRPAHLFGGSGILVSGAGVLINLYLTILWFAGQRPIGNRPLLFLGILLVITGVQLFSVGLLGEMLVKSWAKSDKEYSVKTHLK